MFCVQSTFHALSDMSDASQLEYLRQLAHDVLEGLAKLQHAAISVIRHVIHVSIIHRNMQASYI